MTVYVFKEYWESEWDRDETIKVFAHRQDAVNHIISRFRSYLEDIGADMEEVIEDAMCIDDDFIGIHRRNENRFFTVEEQKVW